MPACQAARQFVPFLWWSLVWPGCIRGRWPLSHPYVLFVYDEPIDMFSKGRSDANIGSLSRPHTGVEAVESIQEQVRKLYSAAPNPAYTKKPVTSAAHAAKREGKMRCW